MFDLKDKKIIVAGGSGLIGAAIIEGFKKIGAKPVNADIRGGDEYYNMHPDYTSSLHDILRKHKPVEVFVNCTYPRDTITAVDGWLATTDIVASHMTLDGGSIINFGSIYGNVGADFDLYFKTSMAMTPQYSLVKGGYQAAHRTYVGMYSKFNVRFNLISPGGVYNHQPQAFVERYERKTPLGGMLQPEDLVGTVLYFASDMSKRVTGQELIVDGGFTSL